MTGTCPDDGVTGIWLADPTGAVPDSLVVRTVDVSSGPIWGPDTDQFTFDQLDQEQSRPRAWIADLDGNAAPLTEHGDLSDRAVIGPSPVARTGDGSGEQPTEPGESGQPAKAPASSASTAHTAPADRPADGSEPDDEATGEAPAPVDDGAEESTQPTAVLANTARDDDRTLLIALAASAILATAGAVFWRFKLRT